MDRLVRVLSVLFWIAFGLTLAWLVVSTSNSVAVERLFGNAGSSFVYTVLLGVMAACSGVILWLEWRENPIEESEYGEWTGAQLCYAIAFTFFLGFISLVNWYFSL